MIKLSGISLRRGHQLLLDRVDLVVHKGSRMGLIGKNGTGKSSLFAMLRQNLESDAGDLSIPKSWAIAHVAQESPSLEKSAVDYVLDGDAELRLIEQQLLDEIDGEKIGRLHAKIESINGYTAMNRAAQLMHGHHLLTYQSWCVLNQGNSCLSLESVAA